jgi:hypothetical protein
MNLDIYLYKSQIGGRLHPILRIYDSEFDFNTEFNSCDGFEGLASCLKSYSTIRLSSLEKISIKGYAPNDCKSPCLALIETEKKKFEKALAGNLRINWVAQNISKR